MFWLLTLPFRIVFGILFGLLALPFALLAAPFALLLLPFVLLRLIIKATIALVMLPVVLVVLAIGATVAFLTVSFAVLAPLLPLAFLVFCIWVIVRMASPSVRPI
jgi:hypothetical protein